MCAMVDPPPPEPDPPAPPSADRGGRSAPSPQPDEPGRPVPPVATPAQPGSGRVRANALATLGFAALTLGSLAVPWAAYSGESGGLSWSGFDVMGDPDRVADSLSTVVTCLHLVQWLSIGLIVLSVLRLIAPAAGLAWAVLIAAVVLVLCAVVAAFRFHGALRDVGAFAPDMRAGPIVTAVAAALCAVVAARGPAAQQGRPGR